MKLIEIDESGKLPDEIPIDDHPCSIVEATVKAALLLATVGRSEKWISQR